MDEEHDPGVPDPLGVERDHAKAAGDLAEEGPSLAQMATTYGSSFVDSDDQAARLASEPSADRAGPSLGDDGNPGGAANTGPVERPPQQTIDGSPPRP